MNFAKLITEGYHLTDTNFYSFKHILENVFGGTFEFFVVQRKELPYYYVDTPNTVCVVRHTPGKKEYHYDKAFKLLEGDKILTSNIHPMIDKRIVNQFVFEDVYHWIHDELGLVADVPDNLDYLKSCLADLFISERDKDAAIDGEALYDRIEEMVIANILANPTHNKHMWIREYGIDGSYIEDWLEQIPNIEECYEEGPFNMKIINKKLFEAMFFDTMYCEWAGQKEGSPF